MKAKQTADYFDINIYWRIEFYPVIVDNAFEIPFDFFSQYRLDNNTAEPISVNTQPF